jgi:hypothetical protein
VEEVFLNFRAKKETNKKKQKYRKVGNDNTEKREIDIKQGKASLHNSCK